VLFLGGQHDSDEVSENIVKSYTGWRHADVDYVEWSPGHSVGNLPANTLFVLGGMIRSESEVEVIGHDTVRQLPQPQSMYQRAYSERGRGSLSGGVCLQ
jgi:hypothetical protein